MARRLVLWIIAASLGLIDSVTLAHGQGALSQEVILGDSVVLLDLAVGRSIPMSTPAPIERVSLVNPDVADVVLLGERDLVVNALDLGVTDLILWQIDGRRFHYRVSVHSATDRKQVLLQVRVAEVNRDFMREIGASFLFKDQNTRVGTGFFITDPGKLDEIAIRASDQFATILSVGEVKNLIGLLELAEQTGRVKILAEPNLIAADGEEASFLAGGELPVPIAQPVGVGGVQAVTIQYEEFGIQLTFEPEILSDSLVKLKVEPEISNLDFANGIETSGFLVPAFRTRRTLTTVDIRPGQTLAIAGLLDSAEQKVNTGVPLLKDIPVLGLLFSNQTFRRMEVELLVLVTPLIIDPMAPPPPPPTPGEEGAGGGAGEGGSGQ